MVNAVGVLALATVDQTKKRNGQFVEMPIPPLSSFSGFHAQHQVQCLLGLFNIFSGVSIEAPRTVFVTLWL